MVGDFVGSLLGGEEMATYLSNAMECVTTLLGTVTSDATLATLAFGFVLARGAIRVVKRLAHIGG